jgi:pseudouridine-5'-monophosphatase
LTAAKKLGHDLVDTSTCLVFEDAPSGVLAGLNAGMHVCWIPDINLAVDNDLKERVSDLIFSMEDFGSNNLFYPQFQKNIGSLRFNKLKITCH